MELSQVLAGRQSVRQFAARDLEESKLRVVLEAAISAPSAGNLQAYEIYVVRQRHARERLARAALRQEFIAQAPLTLVFCSVPGRSASRYGRRGEELYSVQDATIACTFAMLAATDQGLSSVWVGAFDDEAVRAVIGGPAGHRPVALLTVGYGAEQPERTPRRPLSRVVHEVR